MKISKLLRIINEEFQNFYSDWQTDDEPSMSLADKYFEKTTGHAPEQSKDIEVNAELVGFVNKSASRILPKPVSIYKNPRNLIGIDSSVRAILTNNVDLYIAQKSNLLHEDMFELLIKIGAFPYQAQFEYGTKLPEAFIAVVRAGESPSFGQSTAYDSIPIYYRTLIDEANNKFRGKYSFKILPIDN
jgi:hypothetical protein